SGQLPPGVTLSSTGTFSGAPSTAGTYTITVHATDAGGQQATKSLSVLVIAALVITTTTLPSGMVGLPYTVSVLANGGLPPVSWTILTGQLPPGLSLSSSGALLGTPSAAGSSTFTLQATDSLGNRASQSYSVSISATSVTDDFNRTSLGPNWTI